MRFLVFIFVIAIAGAVFFIAANESLPPITVTTSVASTTQSASGAASSVGTTTDEKITTTSSTATTSKKVQKTATSSAATSTTVKITKKPASKPINPGPKEAPLPQVIRANAPYTTAPQSFESVDAATRRALVNILCMPQAGTLRPISGSGVIIDPRGVILTNAHVAQYILLSESSQINLTCIIRNGSPAYPRWKAEVLYIPPVWVNAHYQDLNLDHVSGTGEHDYALLLITQDMQGNPITSPLPYLPTETRENVAFQGDSVLGAGYPAEFVGGIVAQQNLYAVTSISSIRQLLTFITTSVDVFSIGGVIEAQGGSSGGPVVNAWNHVVGIITTTSEGATTAERDLHALSLNYINRDLAATTGKTLESMLSQDVSTLGTEFSRETAPGLIQKYIDYLIH